MNIHCFNIDAPPKKAKPNYWFFKNRLGKTNDYINQVIMPLPYMLTITICSSKIGVEKNNIIITQAIMLLLKKLRKQLKLNQKSSRQYWQNQLLLYKKSGRGKVDSHCQFNIDAVSPRQIKVQLYTSSKNFLLALTL